MQHPAIEITDLQRRQLATASAGIRGQPHQQLRLSALAFPTTATDGWLQAGVPEGGSYQVELEALRSLAAVFEHESDRLARAVPAFRDTSYSVNDAFGMLGPSEDALRAFLDLAHRDSTELGDLARFLEGNATALRAAVGNYARA